MPVPADIFALSQTAGSNFPGGTESPNTADDYFRFYAACLAVLRDGQGFAAPVQLASASTTSIGAQVSPFVEITGTTTITSFGTTYRGPRFLRFTGVLTLTHNATTLNLPGAANITTAAGDTCLAVPNFAGNGWNVVQYQLAAGGVVGTVAIANGGTGQTTAAAAFGALKQDATTSATGVVELATSAEAIAGSDAVRAITPATLFAGLNASGSAPLYACRAWATFTGSTGALLASGNVSSITRVAAGRYTVNFSTAMPDANFSLTGTFQRDVSSVNGTGNGCISGDRVVATPRTTTAASIVAVDYAGSVMDPLTVFVQIFR